MKFYCYWCKAWTWFLYNSHWKYECEKCKHLRYTKPGEQQ